MAKDSFSSLLATATMISFFGLPCSDSLSAICAHGLLCLMADHAQTYSICLILACPILHIMALPRTEVPGVYPRAESEVRAQLPVVTEAPHPLGGRYERCAVFLPIPGNRLEFLCLLGGERLHQAEHLLLELGNLPSLGSVRDFLSEF